jgi:hypothetical protein
MAVVYDVSGHGCLLIMMAFRDEQQSDRGFDYDQI